MFVASFCFSFMAFLFGTHGTHRGVIFLMAGCRRVRCYPCRAQSSGWQWNKFPARYVTMWQLVYYFRFRAEVVDIRFISVCFSFFLGIVCSILMHYRKKESPILFFTLLLYCFPFVSVNSQKYRPNQHVFLGEKMKYEHIELNQGVCVFNGCLSGGDQWCYTCSLPLHIF